MSYDDENEKEVNNNIIEYTNSYISSNAEICQTTILKDDINQKNMIEINFANKAVETIFTEPKLAEVLCSLYDNDLKPIEISGSASVSFFI